LLAYCLLVSKIVFCFYRCKNNLHIWFVLLRSVFKGLLRRRAATFKVYHIFDLVSITFQKSFELLF